MKSRLPVCVAAGNPVTAQVGADVLRAGGNAADASVAMVLASCVAETIFTGLAGGGFATYYDAATGQTTCLDFFTAVPGLGGTRGAFAPEVAIDFGGQIVPYSVGAATVAVPGTPAGLAAIHQRWGRTQWQQLVAPAIRHAEKGVSFAPLHSAVLTRVAPAMLMGEGRRAYSPGGKILAGGARLHHPGLDRALHILSVEGAEAFYTGRIAEEMLRLIGDQGDLGAADLVAYEVAERSPRVATLANLQIHARGDDLDDLLGTIGEVQLSDDPGDLAVELVRVLRARPKRGDTTSIAVTDPDGNACALTTSLGLSSGVWLPEYGLHLNSMLGRANL